MAHFAKVLSRQVVQVIVAEPEFFDTFRDSSPRHLAADIVQHARRRALRARRAA